MSILKTLKYNLLWVIYFIFVVLVILFKGEESLFISKSALPAGKYIAWVLYFSFLGYSIYVSSKESFFKSLKRMYPILWSRQIGIDLYLGLVITSYLIYLNEGSILILALWIVPILIYANLATLLYLAMNYDALIAHFI